LSKAGTRTLSDWQRPALADLRAVAGANPDSVTIVAEHGLDEEGVYWTTVRLPTGDLPRAENGLPVNRFEEVVVGISATPLSPPAVVVQHDRFAGHSHVLQGRRLCVYLDPAREWNPNGGMAGFLEQLWRFFAEAVAGRFDPAIALYHPVGGVLHQTEGTPTVVVRDQFPAITKPFTRAQLHERSGHRLDLKWVPTPEEGVALATVIVVPVALAYGAGTTLVGLLGSIAGAGHPKPEALLRAFAATAARNADGSALYFVLAVPNKAGAHHHLVVGRLSGTVGDELRRLGSLADIDLSRISPNIRIEWCSVSDERPEITTRRDTGRPVNAFAGKTVHIWGCGGLGSWIAEFIARAGATHIVVCDPGSVGGGLLVRQNYTEEDIGLNKAEALGVRLRSLKDSLTVDVERGPVPSSSGSGLLPGCDVLIDATVSVVLGGLLDAAARTAVGARPVIAQVATDSRSGTLGIVTVASPDRLVGPAAIDDEVGRLVLADGSRERFHPLWNEPSPGDEIIPTRGCSTPTFHGSAADLAAVAGVLVSLLGPHVATLSSGTHLVALPHAVGGPAHVFVEAPL
jgi:hypothetical protein